MTADREERSELPIGATTATRTISHQEVKCSITCIGWAGNQLIATRDCCEVKGRNSMTVRGRRSPDDGHSNHP